MKCDRSQRRRRLAVAALVVVGLTAWTYSPVREFDFASYDDLDYVVENPHIVTGLSAANVVWAFKNPYFATGGPLTWLSHMGDAEWFGLNAGGHHVTSAILHTAGAVLLLAALFLATGSVIRSAIVAALFAVHPLHVESVAWVAERKDVLSGVWWFAAIAAYVWYSRRPGWPRYLLVIALFVLGLMSKPMVVTLPFVLMLMDRWPLGQLRSGGAPVRAMFRRRLFLEKLPMLALGAVAIGLTFIEQQARGAVPTVDLIPVGARIANAVVSYMAYLEKMVWPAGLIPYYPFRLSIPFYVVAGSGAMLLIITIVVFRQIRQRPSLTFGWLWYLGTLVPVIGLVQVGGHAMADRFTYLPLVGIFIAIVWWAAEMATRWRVSVLTQMVIAAGIVAALSTTARAQTYHWQDGLTLWQHTVTVDPTNARAFSNLGVVLAQRGRAPEAILAYEAAIRLQPGVAQTHNNLGVALETEGRLDGAVSQFREALRLNPAYLKPRTRLANLLARSGATAEAIEHFQVAVRLSPDDTLLHANLAIALARNEQPAQGLVHMLEAIRLDPSSARWYYFAALMKRDLGQPDEARTLLQKALTLDPGNAAAVRALNEIGR